MRALTLFFSLTVFAGANAFGTPPFVFDICGAQLAVLAQSKPLDSVGDTINQRVYSKLRDFRWDTLGYQRNELWRHETAFVDSKKNTLENSAKAGKLIRGTEKIYESTHGPEHVIMSKRFKGSESIQSHLDQINEATRESQGYHSWYIKNWCKIGSICWGISGTAGLVGTIIEFPLFSVPAVLVAGRTLSTGVNVGFELKWNDDKEKKRIQELVTQPQQDEWLLRSFATKLVPDFDLVHQHGLISPLPVILQTYHAMAGPSSSYHKEGSLRHMNLVELYQTEKSEDGSYQPRLDTMLYFSTQPPPQQGRVNYGLKDLFKQFNQQPVPVPLQ